MLTTCILYPWKVCLALSCLVVHSSMADLNITMLIEYDTRGCSSQVMSLLSTWRGQRLTTRLWKNVWLTISITMLQLGANLAAAGLAYISFFTVNDRQSAQTKVHLLTSSGKNNATFSLHNSWLHFGNYQSYDVIGLQSHRSHSDGECAASECSFMCKDMIREGRARFLIDTGVHLAYTFEDVQALNQPFNKGFNKSSWAYVSANGQNMWLPDDSEAHPQVMVIGRSLCDHPRP